MNDEILRYSISLPAPLLKELDALVKAQNYASRSEFTRDIIREYLGRKSWSDSSSEATAVLVISYDHHEGELLMRKMRLEHASKVEIICTNHIHIDHHNCLETLILRGVVRDIEEFSANIKGLKGVKFSQLVRASVPKF